MARAKLDKSYFTFVKGLITEASPLTFPENASVDEDNFVLNIDGSRNRRLGMDYESSYSTYSQTVVSTDAIGVFKWESVDGDASHNCVVVQTGSTIHIYEDTIGSALSANKATSTINLLTYKVSTVLDAVIASTPVSMAFGKGVMFVAGTYTEPFYISYDSTTGTYSATTYSLEERDFDGVNDTYAIDYTPATLTAEHSYNLRNQGWTSVQIGNYFAGAGVYPSNAMQWQNGKYVNPSTGADTWSSTQLDSVSVGTSAAPKGHYIRSLFDTTDPASGSSITISSITNPNSTTLNITTSAAHGLVTSDTVIIGGTLYNVVDTFAYPCTPLGTYSIDGSYTVTVTSTTEFSITLTHPYSSLGECLSWVTLGYIVVGSTIGTLYAHRPSITAFFAGRVWYAGIVSVNKLSTRIYFSQIINSETEFGLCYQRNDPTSELVSDILPNDGGFISIPDAGIIVGMAVTTSNLLIFATNGVWAIGGGSTGFFTADDYGVQKVTNVGCISPKSIVVAEGTPMFAGYQGIYMIDRDKISGALSAVSMTTNTVQSLYKDIPAANKPFINAQYDDVDKKVVFLFSNIAGDVYEYNRALTFDVRLQAFYPATIPNVNPYIAGFIPRYGQSTTTSKLTYLTVISGTSITFSDYHNTSFLDWYTYDTTGVDAAAYLITGYELLGDAMRHRQAPYIFCYFTRTEMAMTGASDLVFDNPSSCKMEVRWDWSDNSVSGKVASSQQVYRLRRMFALSTAGAYDDGMPVVVTRNKVRGRGRAMNVKFSTEAGYDCKLLGWAVEYDAEKQQ